MKPIKIAIQKSGRLKDGSIEILKACGIKIDNGKDQLKASAKNFPLELLYLRNSDIPKYVEDGVADAAIIGENTLVEKSKTLKPLLPLGFSKCKLSLAVPKHIEYSGISFFEGKRIATSYPESLQLFLDENNINASIHEISGSVEIAPNIGLSDGICDLVSTGSTLFKNGLKEVETLFHSEAVLIKSPKIDAEALDILQKIIFRIESVLAAKNNKYVLLNAPNEKIEIISKILPGMKSPTILPLAQEGWSSLHSVINENEFWENIDLLKKEGAEGILIVPIEKMIY